MQLDTHDLAAFVSGQTRRSAAACVLVFSLACAAKQPTTTPPDPTPPVPRIAAEPPAPTPTSPVTPDSAAPQAAATASPIPDAPAPTSADTPKQGAAVAAAQVQFATLAPFHHASLHDGWLLVRVAAVDAAALTRVQDATDYAQSWLWAGHRSIPAEVRELGPIHVVSPSGVKRLDAYGRIAADVNGWVIAYRRTAAKEPVLVCRGAPAAQARVRVAPEPKPIKRTHPMAVRMRELLVKADQTPDVLRRLGSYALQIVPGSFPGADRIVTVTATARGVDAHDPGEYAGVVFTLDTNDATQQVVVANGDPTIVDGIVDVDGDGLDEVITTSEGYESGSGDFRRLSQGNVETTNLWSHDE